VGNTPSCVVFSPPDPRDCHPALRACVHPARLGGPRPGTDKLRNLAAGDGTPPCPVRQPVRVSSPRGRRQVVRRLTAPPTGPFHDIRHGHAGVEVVERTRAAGTPENATRRYRHRNARRHHRGGIWHAVGLTPFDHAKTIEQWDQFPRFAAVRPARSRSPRCARHFSSREPITTRSTSCRF
jgi:hypothetical protein